MINAAVIERAILHANDEVRYAISLSVCEGDKKSTEILRKVQDRLMEALDEIEY